MSGSFVSTPSDSISITPQALTQNFSDVKETLYRIGTSYNRRGKRWQREQALHWEHEGNCALRDDNLKLVRQHEGDWELYDMESDRTEMSNMAKEQPQRVEEMSTLWDEWAKRVGVLPWPLKQIAEGR